jgi:hypothetical protein
MSKPNNQYKQGFTMEHIKFIKETEQLKYQPDKQVDTFYQICKFKNPKTQLFQVRKILFNEKGKIIKSFEKDYEPKIIKKFLKDAKVNKYRLYPSYFISQVAKPNKSDLCQVQSLLINDKAPAHGWLDNGWANDEFIGAPYR